jgi:hypothetical protein
MRHENPHLASDLGCLIAELVPSIAEMEILVKEWRVFEDQYNGVPTIENC